MRAFFKIAFFIIIATAFYASSHSEASSDVIKLPEPRYSSSLSAEEALKKRRSERAYKKQPSISLSEVSQILWAAQGITDPKGFRTAPSAGALYPIEIYLVAGEVIGLSKGVYKYIPNIHGVAKVKEGDERASLSSASLGQSCVKDGLIVLVIAAVYDRTTRRYGQRGIRYVHMESGNVSQNIYLQCVSLNLGTVAVGAFDDEGVKRVIGMLKEEAPLLIMPIGRLR